MNNLYQLYYSKGVSDIKNHRWFGEIDWALL